MSRPAKKKATIDEAAFYMFAKKGLAGTTIKDIARRAGVAEGALYRHYPSKLDMAVALFRTELEAFSPGLEEILFDRATPFSVRLRNAIHYMYAYYRDHPVRFSFILLTQHGFPEDRAIVNRYDPNAMVVRFIEEGIREGSVIEQDPEVLAAMLMGAVLRPAIIHRWGRLEMEPKPLGDSIAEVCAAMLLKPSASNI